MSINRNLFEGKGEPKRNQAEALLLTSLMPYHYVRLADLIYVQLRDRTKVAADSC